MDVHRKYGTRPQRSNGLKSRLVFEQLNPWVMFTYYILTIAFSMTFIHPIFLGCELLIVILLNVVSKNGKQLVAVLQGSLFMMAFIMIMNPIINNHGTHIIMTIGGTIITVEAVVYGALMALSLAIVMVVFVSYNKSFTSQKFMYLFSRISPRLTLLTLITIRFVPLFIQRFKNIVTIQATRGIQMTSGSVKHRAKSGMRLLEVLLVNSFYNALQTADSMTARGYASGKRTSYERYRFTLRDFVSLGLLLVGSGICFYSATKGVGRLAIYPTLGKVGLSASGIGVLGLVILIYSFPIILEAWEWVWWKLSKLKG
ncbi:energy-coupling factor transporter transmembrane component T [Lentilactobacillus sp. Marseille-Q4993]|uniref:energy-coupling factor transporter transmembrane component T n=1 Tax=Lentilactobacillus sp. Marseille-Q4993 TaxID=3039492 RepID=UPI0024BCE2BA|nr:energy-coupling factor transporter transmembrane component T [Lentilactobacillus sp. Marseille-Q4993]